jgi:hypothetical protein
MKNTALVITSIAADTHPVLKQYALETKENNVAFVMIGDTKSPAQFSLEGCDFYSVSRQKDLAFTLARELPFKHYARKNLGYLIAIQNGAEVVIETDDDNIPLADFWQARTRTQQARVLTDTSWTNVYRYFSGANIWPRGFALEALRDPLPPLPSSSTIECPVQQGLADDNPDVDAIYRLTQPLPIQFNKFDNVALGDNAICPFNSQNTTWFKETFALLYLPSYCSFRMTDIWRSFIAQRILWTCGWTVLFHNSTVRQERNDHSLMGDFKDEISGYTNNLEIMRTLGQLDLAPGVEAIPGNLRRCYQALVQKAFIGAEELPLVEAWLHDLEALGHHRCT